jgi:hypothetical protein
MKRAWSLTEKWMRKNAINVSLDIVDGLREGGCRIHLMWIQINIYLALTPYPRIHIISAPLMVKR